MGYPGRSQGVAAKAKKQFRGGCIGFFVCHKALLLLQGKLDLLLQVYGFPFPVQEGDQLTQETDLYTPIYNTIYQPVNMAADALGLNVTLSMTKGTLCCHPSKQADSVHGADQHNHCLK